VCGRSGARPPGESRALVPAFATARRAEEVADSPSVQPAEGDDPVVDDDPAAAAENRYAIEPATADHADQAVAGGVAAGVVPFGASKSESRTSIQAPGSAVLPTQRLSPSPT